VIVTRAIVAPFIDFLDNHEKLPIAIILIQLGMHPLWTVEIESLKYRIVVVQVQVAGNCQTTSIALPNE
jgi:hypothetical protein